MLGRLARYLRVVGCDVAYVPGLADEEIERRCAAEGRRLLTRDVRLAGRRPDAILLRRTDLAGQWAELGRLLVSLPQAPAFSRCTLCNGVLTVVTRSSAVEAGPPARGAPASLRYRCCDCGHLYSEGSHTANMRARLATWGKAGSP